GCPARRDSSRSPRPSPGSRLPLRAEARKPRLDLLARKAAAEEGHATFAVGRRLGAGVDLQAPTDHVKARPASVLGLDDPLDPEDRLGQVLQPVLERVE